jgi:hypothetical protein
MHVPVHDGRSPVSPGGGGRPVLLGDTSIPDSIVRDSVRVGRGTLGWIVVGAFTKG